MNYPWPAAALPINRQCAERLTHEQPSQRSHPKTAISGNLDLLRAIAVLCVFISHLLGALGVHNAGSLGRFGVILFFVHTPCCRSATSSSGATPATAPQPSGPSVSRLP